MYALYGINVANVLTVGGRRRDIRSIDSFLKLAGTGSKSAAWNKVLTDMRNLKL